MPKCDAVMGSSGSARPRAAPAEEHAASTSSSSEDDPDFELGSNSDYAPAARCCDTLSVAPVRNDRTYPLERHVPFR